mgnify:CR=1 FL=1
MKLQPDSLGLLGTRWGGYPNDILRFLAFPHFLSNFHFFGSTFPGLYNLLQFYIDAEHPELEKLVAQSHLYRMNENLMLHKSYDGARFHPMDVARMKNSAFLHACFVDLWTTGPPCFPTRLSCLKAIKCYEMEIVCLQLDHNRFVWKLFHVKTFAYYKKKEKFTFSKNDQAHDVWGIPLRVERLEFFKYCLT